MQLSYEETEFLARLLGHHFVGGGDHPDKRLAQRLSDRAYTFCHTTRQPGGSWKYDLPLPDLKTVDPLNHIYGDRVILTFEKG